ncbi:proton-conducting transporter transmembrane domain-containing protein [Nannocystis bainbridge]|uniref:Proton-conducting transporter membrane subunit n=1 Tax=Nannocystis bainbridge TaxID=2995303 RepID=A0ABT5E0Y5_9BACT|nr:proton-conducting transporter membrane subunit [Nannocystis bainbridge]MDC0719528.1 proton-conducting transporter membrane subunit [Nannocystis bainbridge]
MHSLRDVARRGGLAMIEAVVPFGSAAIVGLWGVLSLLAARAGQPAGLGRLALGRAVPAGGLVLALVTALAGLTAPDLVGELQARGAVVVDRLAALFDALLVTVLLAAVIADPRPGSEPRAVWGRGMLLLTGAGAMLAVRAADWASLVVGLELATLAAGLCLAAGREGEGEGATEAGRESARTWLLGQGLGAASLWLGAGLLIAATGTVRLHELGARVGAAFLRWGASTTQAAVDVLQAKEAMPAGLIAHARDAAVEGMAPAALYVPGALLVLAGLLVRAGVFPLLAGRTRVAGRAGLCGWVATELVVRTAAVAALIRVFVAALHTPRVVYAPYGWGTAAAVVGGVAVVVCGLRAVRAADLRRLLAWAGAAQVGMTLLAIAAAANFVAHAGLRAGGLEVADHYVWGHTAAEAAVAAAVFGHAVFALAAMTAMAAAAAVEANRGLVDLTGAVRRSPVLAGALVVAALTLAGAPPTAGLAGRWWWFTAVLEDSNVLVRVMAAAAAVGSALVGWACLRPLLAALTPAPGGTGSTARPRRGALVVAAVLSGMLVGAGLWAHVAWDMVQEASAGIAFQAGSKGRREWLGRATE